MQHGADPSIQDGEGCAGIHLAAQFGFTAIMSYIVAKGVSVNAQDKNGMSPLMWSAYRCTNPEPTRVLLTLGASSSMQDFVQGNTAAHWACLAKNYAAIATLVSRAPDSLSVSNSNRDRPIDIIDRYAGLNKKDKKQTFVLNKRVYEKMNAASPSSAASAAKNSFRTNNPVARLLRNRNFRLGCTYAAPFFVFYTVCVILNTGLDYLIKLFLFALLYIALFFASGHIFDERLPLLLPLSIGIGTKVWYHIIWFTHLQHHAPPWFTVSFVAAASFLWYNFVMTWRGDPGNVVVGEDERNRTIIELAERDGFDHRVFCTTCLIKKPLRSKHCAVCDRCVAKFDHHWYVDLAAFSNINPPSLFLSIAGTLLNLIHPLSVLGWGIALGRKTTNTSSATSSSYSRASPSPSAAAITTGGTPARTRRGTAGPLEPCASSPPATPGFHSSSSSRWCTSSGLHR